MDARRLFGLLEDAYGHLGWWPLLSRAGQAGYDAGGYAPGAAPRALSGSERFELAAGALLTQNTAWRNVERALAALLAQAPGDPAGISPEAVLALDEAVLAGLIRPAGYYNQKAARLRELAVQGLAAGWWRDGPGSVVPSRAELLAVRGIGPESADSILLYAFAVPSFVVDAYTRRLLARLAGQAGRLNEPPACAGSLPLGFDPLKLGYEALRSWFMAELPPEAEPYRQAHALIVEHAKRHCRAKPDCRSCPLAP